jgi:hypothetical protein
MEITTQNGRYSNPYSGQFAIEVASGHLNGKFQAYFACGIRCAFNNVFFAMARFTRAQETNK